MKNFKGETTHCMAVCKWDECF